MPIISIIIPTLKEGPFLKETLETIRGIQQLSYEIIVSDGGSNDETIAVAREYTDKIVIWDKPRRQTFGEAKNAGAALASGQFLVFIDADVRIPEPDPFFMTTIAEFDQRESLLAMTVSLRPWVENRSLMDEIFSAPLNMWYIISNNILRYGNASGEFQMIRAEAFRKLGGYREDLAGGEDTDMFNRLGKIGRTHSHWQLFVRHSCRRAHKTGWLKLYWMWMRQGFSVLLLSRTAYDEWTVVR
jgi:glycosyltransferase involved in cell wall biosynthesis